MKVLRLSSFLTYEEVSLAAITANQESAEARQSPQIKQMALVIKTHLQNIFPWLVAGGSEQSHLQLRAYFDM